jgi:hypothetical protein
VSYIVPDGSPSSRRSRRWIWVCGAIVAVIALIVVAFAIGRFGAQQPGRQAPPGTIPGGPDISWSSVGGKAVPISAAHGPSQQTNGLAAGFSHDETGAAVAAINIATRASKAAGPVVYETTVRQQCVGDQDATLAGIRNQGSPSGPEGKDAVEEYFYRITSGDPTGDLVVVSAAALTPESRNLGGYAEFSRTLQWVDGDWKMQVPPGKARLIANVDGYRSLGKPRA